ncbi:hypothetical protein E3N88_07673 [Mikania micrantha]|uniref:Uncharacterized protein n=1 Tax=Mikania micrantha TaxID=192012 RepID=A0A5N6PF56_9ASTR|nr:hypothetical protein E3N88_07673 [Mikania micrantha]
MSFVSSTFCDGLSGKVKKINRVFDVETDIGKMIRVTEAIDDCYVEIGGHKFPAKTVRETELRIVRNRETKKNFKVLNFWTRRGTRRRFEDPSRYAMDLKYLKSSGFLREFKILFHTRSYSLKSTTRRVFHHLIFNLKPPEVTDHTRDRIYKF